MNSKDKLTGIQVARGVACLAVVLFHSYNINRGFPAAYITPIPVLGVYGFYGVNFFFAISGFIICYVTADLSKVNPWTFLGRRALRVYPLYIILTLLSVFILYHGYDIKTSSSNYSTMSVLQSLAIYPQASEPVLAVGWSLEHEILFYLAAALVIPLAGHGGLLLFILTLGYLGYYVVQGFYGHIFTTMHFEFAAGIVAYLAYARGLNLGFVVPAVCGLAGYFLSVKNVPFAASIGGGVALFGFVHLRTSGALKWIVRPLAFVGDISYSLYLGHWVVFRLLEFWLAKISLPGWCAEITRWSGIGLAVGIAYLTWRFIERPFIKLGTKRPASPPPPPAPAAAT